MRPAYFVTAALLLAAVTPAGAVAAPVAAAEVIGARLDAIVAADAAKGFSGAVLVERGGRVILDKGYGAIGTTAMRADTRFWIASSGKQFTSAAIMKLVDEGRLKLNTPIGTIFPEAPADKAAITVGELLSHTSGLGQSYVSERAPDRATAVKRMLDERLIDPPGHRFHYSNSNYQLAVAVVETLSGRPYRQFVTEELWRPAGLTDTGFAGEAGAAQVAPAREPTPARLAAPSWGGEGVFSTTHDLARWYAALWSGRIISRAGVEAMFDEAAPIEEGHAALGWFIGHSARGTVRLFTRGNEDFGPNSLIYDYPDKRVTIVVLSHAGQADESTSWSRKVHGEIEQALGL